MVTETNKSFNPDMLIVARQSRGLTQRELADKCGIAHSKLSRIENGLTNASSEIIKIISVQLGYPEEFFYQSEEIYGIGIGLIYHRKRKNIPANLVNQIDSCMNIRRIHLKKLLASTYIPECRFKFIDLHEYDGDIEGIARVIRASLFLPNGPIKNLTKTIEDAGGVVIMWDFGTRAIDAVSQWAPGFPPVFYVNKSIPCDRYRFSLAHELAHIIMHTTPNPDMESEANRFAAEFLMPQSDIRPQLYNISLPTLAKLKRYWKVSMQALLIRAKTIGVIGEGQYRYLWTMMGSAGYKTREPIELDIPMEEPSTLKHLIDIHIEKLGYGVKEFSALFTINQNEFRSMYLDQNCHLSIV